MRYDTELAALLGPDVELDNDAYTMEELCQRSGRPRSTMRETVCRALDSGTWEQVFKRSASGRIAKAYRPTRQNTP